ncbi:MAG TPA: hypothetical protein VEU47_12620 [Candidatus Cybelea sp.]|nr:hypothetical protein [Candidatus Cybelea sp.]
MTQAIDPRVAALYRDCQDLARYIAKARREIAQMRPEEMKKVKLPRAGQELEAIVRATEEATHTIMAAAEEVMAADKSDAEGYRTIAESACMRIFEACSFQDITGQRITKVVNTLTYIEERLNALQKAWGPDLHDDPASDEPGHGGDALLLNGPALAGEGVDQAEVDKLIGDVPNSPKSAGSAPAKGNGTSKQAEVDRLFD